MMTADADDIIRLGGPDDTGCAVSGVPCLPRVNYNDLSPADRERALAALATCLPTAEEWRERFTAALAQSKATIAALTEQRDAANARAERAQKELNELRRK